MVGFSTAMLVFWGVPFNVNFTMPTWSRKWAGLAASGEKNISATNMKQTLEPKKHICSRWASTCYKWSYGAPVNGRKSKGFAWGYFTTISGVIWDPTHNCFFGPTLLCFPKNPDMSLERDFPYTPILGIEAINPTLGRGLDS